MTKPQSRNCNHPPCGNVTTNPSGYCYLHENVAAQHHAQATTAVPGIALSATPEDDDTPDLSAIDRKMWEPMVPGWRHRDDASDEVWDEYDSFVMGSDFVEADHDRSAEDAVVFRIPHTTWGDYSGDDLQRANFEAMLEQHEGVVKSVDGGHNSHFLVVRGSDLVKDDGFLLADLDMTDRATYDDEHYEKMKDDTFKEDWDSWRFRDVRSDIEERLQTGPEPLNDEWAGRIVDDLDQDEVLQVFYEGMSHADEWFYMEGATSTHIPERTYEAAMEHVIPELKRRAFGGTTHAVSPDQQSLV